MLHEFVFVGTQLRTL